MLTLKTNTLKECLFLELEHVPIFPKCVCTSVLGLYGLCTLLLLLCLTVVLSFSLLLLAGTLSVSFVSCRAGFSCLSMGLAAVCLTFLQISGKVCFLGLF